MSTYTAPWGKSLRWSSLFIVALAVGFLFGMPMLPSGVSEWVPWLLPLIITACLPFMVRGYEITDDAILVRRPFWKTRLSRANLTSAEAVPRAMHGSLRTCGNGGAFSFTGFYWSRSLGHFRAYVNDPSRTVVLRYGEKAVVISPGDPDGFVETLALPGALPPSP